MNTLVRFQSGVNEADEKLPSSLVRKSDPGAAGDEGRDGAEYSTVMNESCWSVYIIRCGDDSLYTGIATDVERRFGEHVSQGPKAAKYLRGRLPLKIVYRKEIGSRSEASREELRIKRMGVKGKLGLVNGG